MIIMYVGGVGSGKTCSIISELVKRKNFFFTNMELYRLDKKRYRRLKEKDICFNNYTKFKKTGEPYANSLKWFVNFDFWEKMMKKYKDFDIVLDELHNIWPARESGSGRNIAGMKWVSQIRKILGEREKTHFYYITQHPEQADIAFRRLAHVWINCEKRTGSKLIKTTMYNGAKRMIPISVITRKYFKNQAEWEAYIESGKRKQNYFKQDRIIANDFIRYYNSYSLIRFGENKEGYL